MDKIIKKAVLSALASSGLFVGMTALVHGAGAGTAAPSSFYGHEIFAVLHGFLGLLLIMGLMLVLGGLIQMKINGNGFRMIKVGTAMLLVSSVILALSGIYLYSLYRGGSEGTPGSSARSIIKASSRPWVHGIMMEMKEFIGVYVPIIIAMMYVVVKTYGAGFVENKKARTMFTILLALAVVWTVVTFGFGAFITKTVPL